jgi:hypothetical protein
LLIISIINQNLVQSSAAGSDVARTKSSPTAAGNGRWQRIQRPEKPEAKEQAVRPPPQKLAGSFFDLSIQVSKGDVLSTRFERINTVSLLQLPGKRLQIHIVGEALERIQRPINIHHLVIGRKATAPRLPKAISINHRAQELPNLGFG